MRTFVLVKETHNLDLELESSVIMTDFELLLKEAIELIFPSKFRVCYFYFFQAVLRKFQSFCLQVAYRDDPVVNHFVRRTAALPFVPVH